MTEYGQNTTYPLLTSALSELAQAASQADAKFVIVLGDFLGHNYRKNYKKYTGDYSRAGYVSFVQKTYQFLNREMQQAFPSISIYTVVGNNDTYHYDYTSYPGGQFFQNNSSLWSQLIKNPANRQIMQKEFSTAGYYAVEAAPGLRLIVLNSVLFSTKARGRGVGQAAEKELNWFEKQLLIAKNKKQNVFIAMHIPAGIDIYATLKYRLLRMIELWPRDEVVQFEHALQENSSEIGAIFTGHLHTGWYQVLTLSNANSIPIIGTPSISPVYGNNPGFKLFSYSISENKIIDIKSFSLPLNNSAVWKTALKVGNRDNNSTLWLYSTQVSYH